MNLWRVWKIAQIEKKKRGDLPHLGTLLSLRNIYSMWNTLLTAEHPINLRKLISPQNNLLSTEYITYHIAPYSLENTLLAAKYPTHREHPAHCGTPYSPWKTIITPENQLTAELPTHC